MAIDIPQDSPSLCAPDSDDGVKSPGCNVDSVKRDTVHLIAVTSQNVDTFTSVDVPQLS